MKQLKLYKERIWEIVAAKKSIINARKYECSRTYKRSSICGIVADTISGEEYNITLWKDNTLSYDIYGITEMRLSKEQQERLQEEFSQDFKSAHLHLGAIMERNGKEVLCVSAFFNYRWMGLREFSRCAGNMSATMDRCIEWFKQRFSDFVQKGLDINFAETHNLLVEGNY
jgi:hypothetical protein